jgi:hypothetical protein
VFDAPADAAKVTVKVIYRPAFYRVAQQKGWPDEDFLMNELSIPVAN